MLQTQEDLCADQKTVFIRFAECVGEEGLSHNRVMDYDEACFMHLTPGVVHNFPNAVGV